VIIRTKNDLLSAVELLENHETWSYDVETTGLNWRKDKLIGFGCAEPTNYTGFYIVMREWVNGELVTILTEEDVKPVLDVLATKKLIGWNFVFDAAFTLAQARVNLIEALHAEVMLLVHTCDENRFEYGLKSVSASVFGNEALTEQNDLKDSIKSNGGSPKEFFKGNSEIVAKYGLQDNILTCKNFNYWYSKLQTDGLEEFYFNEVVALCKHVTFWMQFNGVKVDVPYLQKTQAEMSEYMIMLEENIQEQIAPYLGPFNKWYIEKNYKFELNARFKQKLGEFIAPAVWPKNSSGAFSFNKADITRAKTLSKTEIKKGVKRPLLEDSEFEDIINGKIRCSKDYIVRVQMALMAEDGKRFNFNILSKDNLKRLLFGTSTTESLLKEKPLTTTPTGQPQVDDDFLEHIKHKYEWVPLLQRYNSLTKIKSTYVDRILEEQEDGVWYPQFHQHRTTSGRYSGDAQQLPRVKSEEEIPDAVVREFTNRIRSFFISGDGYKLVDADYESLEVVVFADDAGDEKLKNIIKNKEDFYSRVAIEVYSLNDFSSDKKAPNFLKKHKPEVRQAAKAFALGIRYGLGDYKLHKDLNISQKEAEHIVKSYFRQFPALKQRMDELQTMARVQGYVRSKGGRLRRLPEIPKLIAQWGECLSNGLELWKEYNEDGAQYIMAKKDARVFNNLNNNALNFPIQSYAASIVNAASIAMAKQFKERGMKAYICLSIHDELCILCPDDEVEAVKIIMRDCMENTTKLSVPLVAEPIVGTRYSEVK
jgi:DNA polymerase I-like protein with 3'-5' exonuclease and polymerase domains